MAINDGTIRNLNEIGIWDGDRRERVRQDDFGCTSSFGKTQVYFKDLERSLVGYIEDSQVVVGCVAWLTSEAILRSLAKRRAVSIIVQKEDFLRPDISSRKGFTRKLRRLYDALPSELDRSNESLGMLPMMSCAMWPDISAVRCVGNHNQDRSPAFPRMHHKFLVFCRYEEDDEEENPDAFDDNDEEDSSWNERYIRIEPYGMWTGSFNLTANSSNSFENAVYMTDPSIVRAYFMEWSQIAALSEPLDWDVPWCEPEWKIGT